MSELGPGVADLVNDVRAQEDVAVADIAREIDVRPGRRRIVAVQAHGLGLVDIDHEGVFFRRVEVLGLDDDGRKDLAVGVGVFDELGLAPVVPGLLGIGAADLLRRREVRAAHPEVREFVEALLGENIDVRVLGFQEAAELLVQHDDLGRVGRRRREVDAIGPRGPGLVVRGQKDEGAARRDGRLLRVEPGVAEDELVAAAHPVGHHPALRAVGRDLPDIVAVVDEQGLVAVGPARRPIRPRLVRGVPSSSSKRTPSFPVRLKVLPSAMR